MADGPLTDKEKENFSKNWRKLADELSLYAGKKADGNPVLGAAALAAAAGFTAGAMGIPANSLLELLLAQHAHGKALKDKTENITQEDIAFIMAAGTEPLEN